MLALEKTPLLKIAAFSVEPPPPKTKLAAANTNTPATATTTAQDRARLQSGATTPKIHPGSIRLAALEGTHKKKTFALATAAITRAPADRRDALLQTIAALETAPTGAITLLSLLANRYAAKLRVADVEALPMPSAYDAPSFLARLELWTTHPKQAEAITGLPEPTQSTLATAFQIARDPETAQLAAEYIAGTRNKRGGWSVVGFLKAMGSPSGDEALEHLARRRRAQIFRESNRCAPLPDVLLDNAARVNGLLAHVQNGGHDFAKGRDDTLRGTIGELLRVEQLSTHPHYADKLIVRGLHILDASGEERTEVDVAVFEKRGDRLVPVLFENVKAGLDCGSEARQQNRIALAALEDPNARFEFPRGTDITEKLDRSAVPKTSTVGPLDDPDYDVSLPATASDLIQVVARAIAIARPQSCVA